MKGTKFGHLVAINPASVTCSNEREHTGNGCASSDRGTVIHRNRKIDRGFPKWCNLMQVIQLE